MWVGFGNVVQVSYLCQEGSSSSSSSSGNNNNNITKSTALATEASTFDFSLTEGQTRRTAMADCEFECSEVVPGLYVGGASVATNRATLQKHNIRHIVNCAASVVPCPFINETYADADTDTDEQKPLHFNYKLLKMVDGRQDDISWFVCEVLHFILAGRQAGHNVLVHCEKGISRSCSYVIAFLMWQHRLQWKTAFEYVKEKRHVCNPNTAFTCNLIEVGDLMHGQKRKLHAFFRLATHLPHDMETPVLKCMRDINTRKLLLPNESYLDPQGIFVLRPGQPALFDTETDNNANTNVQRGMGPFVWIGSQVAAICPEHAEIARKLASFMAGVFTHVDSSVTVVWQGKEPPAFLVLLQRDGKFSGTSYEDLYSLPIISLHTATSTTAQADRSKIDLSKHQFRSRGTSPVIDASSTVKPKPSKPSRLATASSSSPTKTGVRQIDDESVSVSVCVSRTDTGIPVKESSRSDTSAPITLIAGTPPLPVRPSSSHSRPNSGAGSRPNSGATPISMRARSSSSDSTHGHDVSLLSPQQRRTPSPAGMTIPRTPSAGKLPADITLVREPTPVEDLQSETDNGTGNGTGAGIADKNIGSGTIGGGVALLHAHAEIAAASVAQPISVSIAIAGTSQHHSHNNNQNQSVKSILSASSTKEEQNDNDDDECTKPKLYVCIDKEIGIGNEWQAMGVYDDEDLEEALLLLLHCNNGGPHMIWVGEQYDADHENTCIEDETLLEWVCSHVEAGENHKWRDIFPCDMKVQRSGEEDEAFWDLFNEGF